MSTKTKLAMIALGAVITGTQALAHDHVSYHESYSRRDYHFRHDCIDDTWIGLDLSPSVEFGSCEEGEKLKLSRKEKSFPQMKDNPYEVQYWKGSYTRKQIEKVTYQHEVTNWCTGKSILSERKVLSETSTLGFPIDNPNLHDDVYASYQLLPLTEDEAKAALAQAKAECE